MNRKLWSVLASVALVSGLLSFAAGPVSAQSTTTNDVQLFMPTDTTDKDQLSDQWDGTDEAAHVTAIADPDATEASFYVCTDATGGGGVTSAELASNACQLIGTDSSATTAVPFGDRDQAFVSAAAFDAMWDIPANLDSLTSGVQYDIVVRACTGSPSTTTDPAANCDVDFADAVYLDDASVNSECGGPGQPACGAGNGPLLPTGEITGVCEEVVTTIQGDNSILSTDPCGGTGEFTDLAHGGEIPNDDFTLRFTTDDSITEAAACLGTDEGITTQPSFEAGLTPPNTCDIYSDVTSGGAVDDNGTAADASDDFRTWYATFTTPVAEEGVGASTLADVDVAIFGQQGVDVAGVVAECAGAFAPSAAAGNDITDAQEVCVFDEHYAVATVRTAGALNLTFNHGDDSTDAGTTPDDTCQQGNDTTETNRSEDTDEVTACIVDQFGDAYTDATVDEITFESTGAGILVSCDAGDEDDNPPYAIAATATGTRCVVPAADADGQASALIDWGGAEYGDQTITACTDEDGDGCADETSAGDFTATATKTWVATPFDIQLIYADTGTADCAGGDQFKVNTEGDDDTLLACVVDLNGDPASTAGDVDEGDANKESAGEFDLTWALSAGCQSVAFTSNPVTETDEEGFATQQIRAIGEGTCTITVTETNSGASDTVTKSVEPGTGPQPECNDGIDNDGDGAVDYPSDPGCVDINDNTENSDQPGETFFHARTAEISSFKHIKLPGKKKPALRVKGTVDAPDYADCEAFVPVKVQLRASGEWITRKTDVTNENGVWKVLIRDVKGRYRVTATKFEIVDNANNINVCQRARDEARHTH